MGVSFSYNQYFTSLYVEYTSRILKPYMEIESALFKPSFSKLFRKPNYDRFHTDLSQFYDIIYSTSNEVSDYIDNNCDSMSDEYIEAFDAMLDLFIASEGMVSSLNDVVSHLSQKAHGQKVDYDSYSYLYDRNQRLRQSVVDDISIVESKAHQIGIY